MQTTPYSFSLDHPARRWLPVIIILAIVVGMTLHGPIAQLPHYHDFADQRGNGLIPNALDVLSNLPFLVVGSWGLHLLLARRATFTDRGAVVAANPAYIAFSVALVLTALGSSYYHWSPDNARLIWDRLPISLACAALLSAGYAETHSRTPKWLLPVLLCFGVASVLWWVATDLSGVGDLRPYLGLQGAPLILIPVWQWIAKSPRRDRTTFGLAVLLYVLAKAAELNDAQILGALNVISGHTLKHLLASLAALVLCSEMIRNARLATAPATHEART
jgi:hypothetical protein